VESKSYVQKGRERELLDYIVLICYHINMKNLITKLSFLLFIFGFAFVQPAFAITFSTIGTNEAIGSDKDTISLLGTSGASVTDFFAEQNAYPVENPLTTSPTSEVPTFSDYLPSLSHTSESVFEKSENSGNNSNSTTTDSDSTSLDSESSPYSDEVEKDNSTWQERGAPEDSASARTGEDGSIIGTVSGSQLQASVLGSRAGYESNALNRGYVLLPLLLVLLILFLIRKNFLRGGMRSKAATRYQYRVPIRRSQRFSNYTDQIPYHDTIHDPLRYRVR